METTVQNDRLRMKRYLAQYFNAKRKIRHLEKRLAAVRAELRHPTLGSPPMDGMPHGTSISSGAAALTLREADIEDRIEAQIEARTEAMLTVMDTLALLPEDSMEREILELRHIDCMKFSKIIAAVHLTRSPCYEHYNRGLDMLLAMDSVRERLSKYEG